MTEKDVVEAGAPRAAIWRRQGDRTCKKKRNTKRRFVISIDENNVAYLRETLCVVDRMELGEIHYLCGPVTPRLSRRKRNQLCAAATQLLMAARLRGGRLDD